MRMKPGRAESVGCGIFSVLLVNKCVDHRNGFLPGQRVYPTPGSVLGWRRELTEDRRHRQHAGRAPCPTSGAKMKGKEYLFSRNVAMVGEGKEEKSEHC